MRTVLFFHPSHALRIGSELCQRKQEGALFRRRAGMVPAPQPAVACHLQRVISSATTALMFLAVALVGRK